MMKFVIFESDWKSTRRLFDDLNNLENVLIYETFFKNRIAEKLFCSHIMGKLSFLPGKTLWPKFIKYPRTDDILTFVYLGSKNIAMGIDSCLIDYLKKRFPRSKHVGYQLDIHNARKQNIEKEKKIFDKLYIFDSIEAEAMGISYYPVPFSRGLYSDICYVGQDKGRLVEIVKIYDHLSSCGVKCNFYLCNVPKHKQIIRNGITYGDMMDPDVALQCIVNTNCVLELKVGDVTSYSDRVQKAIVYNKKIVSNNPNLIKNKFYTPDMMLIYNDVSEIRADFVVDTVNKISYGYKDEYSPIHFLERIEKDLEGTS